MKKLLLCAFAAAVAAQLWGMVSWMVLPWHMLDFKQFKNDDRVAEVMRSELQGSGIYTLPNMDPANYENEAAQAAWEAKASQGPFVFMSVRADGIEPGMGKPMAIGFVINFIIAAILFWLLSQTVIDSAMKRTVFIAVAGSVGALYPHLANWNWWFFPVMYCLVGIVDLVITWAIAGFAMVKLSDWLDKKAA